MLINQNNTMHKSLLILLSLLLLWSCKSTQNTYATHFSKWIAPTALQQGDTILYIAPAGNINAEKGYMKRADSLLRLWGYVPKYPKDLYKKSFTFGGTDAERFTDLQNALDDPNIKAIWCARGGYGSIRIIENLDFTQFKKHPKWLIGFSDITVLTNLLYKQGYQSVHAIMPISLTHPNEKRKYAIQSLKDFYQGKALRYEIASDSMNISGKGKGELVGGNISLLVSLLGSKHQLNTAGKVLFLEDVGEYTYSYDRMLYALKNAGYFDKLQGLIIGGTSVKKDDDFIGETVKDLIIKHAKNKGYPVIFGFPAGHVVDNRVLVFGRETKIKVNKEKASVIQE
jgi:muramoyltetrapeptide carboxypeptidase